MYSSVQKVVGINVTWNMKKRALSIVSGASKRNRSIIYGLHQFWIDWRHFITMATVMPRRQRARSPATLTNAMTKE